MTFSWPTANTVRISSLVLNIEAGLVGANGGTLTINTGGGLAFGISAFSKVVTAFRRSQYSIAYGGRPVAATAHEEFIALSFLVTFKAGIREGSCQAIEPADPRQDLNCSPTATSLVHEKKCHCDSASPENYAAGEKAARSAYAPALRDSSKTSVNGLHRAMIS